MRKGHKRTAFLVMVVLWASLLPVSAPAVLGADAGYGWQRQESGTTDVLNSVYALNEKSLWAVGQEGTILRGDGESWRKDPQSGMLPGVLLWGVNALDSAHVWAVG
jgi:photosystem II stability/assembly factor-like uncharacterized protein